MTLFPLWTEARRTRVRIMMFHGVGVPEYPAQAFARQIEQLAASYQIVGIDQALQTLASDRAPKRPQMLLTFDDGLRNNHKVAYPVLSRLGLPCTFFVCPALIEEGCWLWNHETRERLRWLPPGPLKDFVRSAGAPAEGVESIVGWMKALPMKKTRELLLCLREMTSAFEPSEQQRACFDLMSWDELLSIDPAIVTIGSHTLTHPILTGLSDTELDQELQGSRQWLEDRLQRRVEHFCYPNGSNNASVVTSVARWYSSAVTTEYGYAVAGDHHHQLRRIAATPKRLKMAWRLHKRYPASR